MDLPFKLFFDKAKREPATKFPLRINWDGVLSLDFLSQKLNSLVLKTSLVNILRDPLEACLIKCTDYALGSLQFSMPITISSSASVPIKQIGNIQFPRRNIPNTCQIVSCPWLVMCAGSDLQRILLHLFLLNSIKLSVCLANKTCLHCIFFY